MNEDGLDAREVSLGGNLVVLRDNKDVPIQATSPDSEHRGSGLKKLHIPESTLTDLHERKKKLVVAFPYNTTEENPEGGATINRGYRVILVEPSKGMLQKEVKARVSTLEGRQLEKVLEQLQAGSDKLTLAPIMEAGNSNLVVDDELPPDKIKELSALPADQFKSQAGESTIHRLDIVTPDEAYERTKDNLLQHSSPREYPTHHPDERQKPTKDRDSTNLSTSDYEPPDSDEETPNIADRFFEGADKPVEAEKELEPQEVE